MNFGDKENRHNRALLNIQSSHSKFKLDERSAIILTEDEITGPTQSNLDSWLRQDNAPEVVDNYQYWQGIRIGESSLQ